MRATPPVARDLGGLFAAPAPVAPPPAALAADDPPRATRAQRTRWATSDAAHAASGSAAKILESIRQSPATCDEIEERLQLTHQAASARINDLMRAGEIIAIGAKLTRSNRMARVWHAKPIVVSVA